MKRSDADRLAPERYDRMVGPPADVTALKA
jgi:hypothetical protein